MMKIETKRKMIPMHYFLNTEEWEHGLSSLLKSHQVSPIEAYQALDRQYQKCDTLKEARKSFEETQTAVKECVSSLSSSIHYFQNALPKKHSVFRVSENTKETYHPFCVFLGQLESVRSAMRSCALKLFDLQNRLSNTKNSLTALLGTLTDLLHHVDNEAPLEANVSALKAKAEEALDGHSMLHKSVSATVTQIHLFEKQTLIPFLQKAEEFSDAKNQGASCSREKLIALTAALNDHCKELLQTLQ